MCVRRVQDCCCKTYPNADLHVFCARRRRKEQPIRRRLRGASRAPAMTSAPFFARPNAKAGFVENISFHRLSDLDVGPRVLAIDHETVEMHPVFHGLPKVGEPGILRPILPVRDESGMQFGTASHRRKLTDCDNLASQTLSSSSVWRSSALAGRFILRRTCSQEPSVSFA